MLFVYTTCGVCANAYKLITLQNDALFKTELAPLPVLSLAGAVVLHVRAKSVCAAVDVELCTINRRDHPFT